MPTVAASSPGGSAGAIIERASPAGTPARAARPPTARRIPRASGSDFPADYSRTPAAGDHTPVSLASRAASSSKPRTRNRNYWGFPQLT